MRKIIGFFLLLIFPAGFCLAKADYSLILKRGIFADSLPPAPAKVTPILKPVAAPPPSLDKIINIKGIFYLPGGGSKAIIDLAGSSSEDFYSRGDTVGNAKILRINEESVVFLYNGKNIELGLDNKPTEINGPVPAQPRKSLAVNADSFRRPEIPKAMPPRDIDFNRTIEKITSDRKLMSSMNVTPSLNSDGKVQGFLVNSLPSGSVPVQMGIQNGDVVTMVNGTPINSLAAGFKVYRNIVNSGVKVVTVEVLRNNQPMLFTYHLQ